MNNSEWGLLVFGFTFGSAVTLLCCIVWFAVTQ